MEKVRPFLYRIAQLGFRPMPGAHASAMTGAGHLFKRHGSLLANPDPRRLDLRASVVNPYQDYKVKVFQQASRIPMLVIADLSRSLSYVGLASKQQTLADFVASAAYSAHQAGDVFSLLGCGQAVDTRWLAAGRLGFGAIPQLTYSLRNVKLKGNAESLAEIHRYLPHKRALVFVVSDFYLSEARIRALFSGLAGHTVVPVVLWDESEYAALPDWGIWKVKDMESQSTRTILLRPRFKQKIQSMFKQRKQWLQHIFGAYAAEPLFVNGAFNADLVTDYFYGRAV
jgi:uncharacterized protein (DUF58 family)